MKQRLILLAFLVLAIVTMSCGVTINLPEFADVKTGPTVSESVRVPLNGEDVYDLKLEFGAGELKLSPGASGALVEGTATYNIEDLRPDIIIDDENVRISTGDLEISGVPIISENLVNEWDLELAPVAMRLRITAGAYDGEYDLGGLALESLHISDGAANVDLTFSEPNTVVMDTFRYDTGASDVSMYNLLNANFEEMIFNGGAGDYNLEFLGLMTDDVDVRIETGLSDLTVTVPEDANVSIQIDSSLADFSLPGSFEREGGDYVQDGTGPTLTIHIDVGVGDLTIRTD